MATSTRRPAAAAAGLLVLTVLVTPGTASARPDAGTAVQSPSASTPTGCPLRRVGDRLVVCDNLTGAGVKAPRWVPEMGSTSTTTEWVPAFPGGDYGLGAPAGGWVQVDAGA